MAHSAHPYNTSKPSVLIVEDGSEYALDYELMFNSFGYAVAFARTPAAAGIAISEEAPFVAALIDADTVDLTSCLALLGHFDDVKILVAASPAATIPDDLLLDARLFRLPVIPREVERALKRVEKQ
ncbi:hypothetical protein [Agrobacterium salinitolerans]|uniref:hypothetical protein n=1 Tax=Agrobacterium salinitolerans TaxID=1183413 RepID=UPI0035B0716B